MPSRPAKCGDAPASQTFGWRWNEGLLSIYHEAPTLPQAQLHPYNVMAPLMLLQLEKLRLRDLTCEPAPRHPAARRGRGLFCSQWLHAFRASRVIPEIEFRISRTLTSMITGPRRCPQAPRVPARPNVWSAQRMLREVLPHI